MEDERTAIPKDNPYDIRLQNIVVSINLGTKVPLDRIAQRLPNAEYEPESFPGLVYRVKDPKASALVFTSGMIILSGINSMDIAKKAAQKIVEDFRSIDIDIKDEPKLDIVNLVASADLGKKIDLNKVVYELGECEYEPEQFPGLVYRMDNPPVVVLIFNSGRIIITGSKDLRIVQQAIEELKRRLQKIKAFKE